MLNNEELLQKCATGNSTAQMQLYKKYSSAVYSSCYRILQNSNEAEEITQDSFIKVFSNIKSYLSCPEKLEYSLRRIATNSAIDVVRRRKQIFEDCDNISDIYITDDDEFSEIPEISEVKDYINSLPEGYKTILTLKLVEDYNNEEIAKELDISTATVRSQFSRAKQKVVEHFKKLRK